MEVCLTLSPEGFQRYRKTSATFRELNRNLVFGRRVGRIREVIISNLPLIKFVRILRKRFNATVCLYDNLFVYVYKGANISQF